MAENDPQTSEAPASPDSETVPEPTRLQYFVFKHPRAAKAVAIVGAVTSALGAVQVARTVQARRQHVVAAGEHAKEALTELSTSVSPTDPEA